MMNFNRIFIFLSLYVLVQVQTGYAKIELPSFISNGMVLQQKSEVSIWGQANKSTAITLETGWNGRLYTTKSNEDGYWKINIPTPKAGGPYQLIISDGDKTILDNVLIGEVWIASGQSNMEMPLRGFSNQKILGGDELIANSENKNIRIFQGNRISKGAPQKDVKGTWQQASPESVINFSAAAYYFAHLLQKELKVPVGIIQVAWGGTAIQSWMSSESLQEFSSIKIPLQENKTFGNKNTPTGLFNAMIHPLIPYKVKGILWYQGEHNVKEPDLYSKLFPTMVRDWREKWNNENMYFLYAQIAPWDYKSLNWKAPMLREAQLKSSLVIPNSGMAVLTDVGEEKDIHPAEKKTVGERFFKLALAKAYGKPVEFSGPVYKSMEKSGNRIILDFDYNKGLNLKKQETANFEIAGSDKKFYPAKAEIKKGKVIISSDEVQKPEAIRYAFRGWAKGNLFNKAGLPASSFRTDDWEIKQ